jgi:hypothetical protein
VVGWRDLFEGTDAALVAERQNHRLCELPLRLGHRFRAHAEHAGVFERVDVVTGAVVEGAERSQSLLVTGEQRQRARFDGCEVADDQPLAWRSADQWAGGFAEDVERAAECADALKIAAADCGNEYVDIFAPDAAHVVDLRPVRRPSMSCCSAMAEDVAHASVAGIAVRQHRLDLAGHSLGRAIAAGL